jgi:hypothetical protein
MYVRSHYAAQSWIRSFLLKGKKMFATDNSEDHKVGREILQRHPRIGKSLCAPIPKLLLFLLLFLLGPAAISAQDNSPKKVTQSDAKLAFEKMKSLSGSWQGTILGISIHLTIRLASSNTALLHEATRDGNGPPDHEITMFYIEGDRLFATHFCDGGNRARLEGKLSADGKTIEFSFIDVTGNTRGGLVKRMVISLIDPNKHVIELLFVAPDGKPMDLRGEFQRTK